MTKTKKLVISALLLALEIILTRFVQIPVVLFGTFTDRINLGFLPVALSGILCGPVYSFAVGGISDFVRALIFPQGAFNPLFTVTAALRGLIYGLILYKKPTYFRIISASLLNFILVNTLLMSVIIKFFYTPTAPLEAVIFGKSPIAFLNFIIQSLILAAGKKPIERNLPNV